jgi:hypothetical protein
MEVPPYKGTVVTTLRRRPAISDAKVVQDLLTRSPQVERMPALIEEKIAPLAAPGAPAGCAGLVKQRHRTACTREQGGSREACQTCANDDYWICLSVHSVLFASFLFCIHR